MKPRQDHSLGDGVFYATDDCRGILSRIIILVIDVSVLVGLCVSLAFILAVADVDLDERFFWTCSALVWVYLAVLKQSRLRTLGYWLTGSEIVTLRGERPSILRMTFRMLLWFFGPINAVYDLAWSGIDDDKQTLRDRFSGTTVIRRGAKPAGRGEVHLERYYACGFAIMYPRVMNRSTYESTTPTTLI